MKRLIYGIPLVLFLVIALYFLWQMQFGRDPALVPSQFIDKPAPMISLPVLETNAPAIDFLNTTSDLKSVRIVNFFASWCVPCRAEHGFLMELAKDQGISLIGIAYKDKQMDALGFLEELGNPFAFILHDLDGRMGIEWGLYGVPETYIIDDENIVRYKRTGPLVGDVSIQKFMTALTMVKQES